MSLVHTLLDPFRYPFFVNGCLMATLCGALCGLTGVYIVLRRMSYIGHGLSHSIFGGFAAASIVQLNYYLVAGLWGVASALLINRVSRRRGIGADAAIGVVTTASFALGIALLTVFGSRGPSFDAALFGSILGVRTVDVVAVSTVALLAVVVIVVRYRSLLFATFDPEVAEAVGLRVARLDALLSIVLALAILAALTTIGVTLVAATLVMPATTVRMVTSRFSRLLPLSAALGGLTGLVGMIISFHVDIPSGTTIVLVGALIFIGCWTVTAGQHRHRRRPGRQSDYGR